MPPPTPNKPAINPATDAAIDNTSNKFTISPKFKRSIMS